MTEPRRLDPTQRLLLLLDLKKELAREEYKELGLRDLSSLKLEVEKLISKYRFILEG